MPSAKARDFQHVALLLGFTLKRTSGSHEQWQHPDGRAVTFPFAVGVKLDRLCFSRFFDNLA
jgi:predicted RNA binding protein YcfA (HicA-like mRNA interferase family)